VKNALRWVALLALPVLVLALGAPVAHAMITIASAAGPHLAPLAPHVYLLGAVVGAGMPTLIDVAKRTDPDGKPAKVAEMLTQTNEVLNDIGWDEGNLPAGHRVTQRTGLPTVYYRLLNQGVPKSKSTTAQIDEACAIIEGRSEIDVKVADFGGNAAAYRASEAYAFTEAMNQQFAKTLFYGNSGVDPEQFTGLAIRYSSTAAKNGQNIILAPTGGGGDNSSIYLVVWGPESIFGIYPEGLAGRA
jgi:hypothetical protein